MPPLSIARVKRFAMSWLLTLAQILMGGGGILALVAPRPSQPVGTLRVGPRSASTERAFVAPGPPAVSTTVAPADLLTGLFPPLFARH